MQLQLRNQRGLGMIEVLAMIPILVATLGCGLFLIYLLVVRLWCQYQLYESLICQVESENKNYCELRLRQRIVESLPIGQLTYLQTQKQQNGLKGSLKFRIQDVQLQIHRQLYLPLHWQQL